MTRPRNILIVDDCRDDIQLMELALLEAGVEHALSVLPDGDQVMPYLRREPPHQAATRPDLIILDIDMPRMTGHQVLEQVKADEELSDIPVIIMSNSTSPKDVAQSYRLHANSHVAKPMEFDSLVNLVETGINNYWFNVVELPPS